MSALMRVLREIIAESRNLQVAYVLAALNTSRREVAARFRALARVHREILSVLSQELQEYGEVPPATPSLPAKIRQLHSELVASFSDDFDIASAMQFAAGEQRVAELVRAALTHEVSAKLQLRLIRFLDQVEEAREEMQTLADELLHPHERAISEYDAASSIGSRTYSH